MKLENNAEGFYKKEFVSVYKIFQSYISQQIDLGSSFAVYQGDDCLIDIFGGYKDKNKKNLWDENTIINTYSVSKGVLAICISILVDRGLLDIDKKLSYYSAVFRRGTKNDVTIRTLLLHQSGLFGWRKKLKTSDLYNPQYCLKLLATQVPFHEPGDETCYHVTTIGFILGEIIYQISKKTAGQFLNDEISERFDYDCFLGTPVTKKDDISDLFELENKNKYMSTSTSVKKNDKYRDIFLNPGIPNINDISKSDKWITSEIPSSNIHSNASSLAKIYSRFVSVDVCSEPLISNITLQKIINETSHCMDYVLRLPMKRSAYGFILDGGKLFGTSKKAFGHTGWGGSVAFADPEKKLGIAYVTNTMSDSLIGDARALSIIEETYKVINSI